MSGGLEQRCVFPRQDALYTLSSLDSTKTVPQLMVQQCSNTSLSQAHRFQGAKY
jgi:hypothetical protein